jgi:SprB repeat/Secretion system C-terminal sorting domain/HYR domain
MMTSVRRFQTLQISGFLLCALVWLANNGNPPTGRTGAPFDGNCADCHNGSNPGGFDGDVAIDGLPATIQPSTTYPLSITITPTAGAPNKGGFQLVAVDANNANVGDLVAINSQSGTETFASREYLEHRSGKSFGGNAVTWNFNWISPAGGVSGNTVKFYMIGNFTNGNSQTSGDFAKAFLETYAFQGAAPVTAAISNTINVLCVGSNTGSATVEADGGIAPYTYLWSNGQTDATAVNLTANTYTVTVTGSGGSGTATASTTISQPPALFVSLVVTGVLSCYQPSVTAAATAIGGTPGYQYAWPDGQNGSSIDLELPGTYSVTVTDANGCTKVASVTVTANFTPPTAVTLPGGTLTCTVSQTTLSGVGSSVGPNFTYQWSTTSGIILSGANTLNPIVGACGTYSLVVTNNINGCTASAVATVSCQTDAPTISAGNTGPLTCTVSNVTLNGNSNTSGVVYAWSGVNFSSNLQNTTTNVPGNYTLIVTNPANGCTSSVTTTVLQNIQSPSDTANVSGVLTCSEDSVRIFVTTNAQNATFAWSGPNGFSAVGQEDTIAAPGVYTAVVTNNANGCTATATITVLQNTTAPIATIAPPGNLTCNNTAVQLNASESSQGISYSYVWTTTNGLILSGDTTLTPIVGAAGTYTLAVTNLDNGCVALATTTIVQIPPVSASIAATTNVSCHDGSNGSASATGTGGNGVLLYAWSNGDTSATISGLTAGAYVVTVSDGNNCTASATAIVVQPDALLANANATGETSLGANDGTAAAAPSGGTPDYGYVWSNGATTMAITNLTPGSYSLTATDANGCSVVQTVTVNSFGCMLSVNIASTSTTCNGSNDGTAFVTLTGAVDPVVFAWSNGVTADNISGLSPGSYTVSVLDANNCQAVLNTNITEPTIVVANAFATGETSLGANDGSATAIPTGGAGFYSFLWSNGVTTATNFGLTPGLYTVTATDFNNCVAVQTVSVSAFNCIITADVTGVGVRCFGLNDGLASVVVNGGQLPYGYSWSNGVTTATANNLPAGNFSVTATDAAGCVVVDSIVIAQPQELVAQSVVVHPVACPSDHNGSVEIVVDGGTLPYAFTGSLDNLGVGQHAVTITDANGCSVGVAFAVGTTDNQPPVVSCPSTIYLCGADFVVYPAPTATDNCGQLTGPPTLISGLPSGAVFNDGTSVQVFRATDAAGNSATCSFAIVVYPIPDIYFDASTDDHNGEGVGSISITPVGGAGNFFFIWNKNGTFFSNSEDLSGLNAGSYTLTITDANGCTSALAPIYINNTVGTNNPDISGAVRLFPNPTASSFNLETRNMTIVSALILDVRGQVVLELQESEWQNDVSVENLSTGIYCLRLTLKDGSIRILKFIKSA